MVAWINAIKKIFKASFSIIIIPVLSVTYIVRHFGVTINSLLAIIFFSQLYIIWAQLEVVLRQTYLLTLEYEPVFKIETTTETVGNSTSIKIKLKNVGKHLARDVLILGRIGKTYLGVECESGIAPGDT